MTELSLSNMSEFAANWYPINQMCWSANRPHVVSDIGCKKGHTCLIRTLSVALIVSFPDSQNKWPPLVISDIKITRGSDRWAELRIWAYDRAGGAFYCCVWGMISWRCRARRIQFVQLFNPSGRAEFWSLYWRTLGQCQPRARRNVQRPRGYCIYLSVYEIQHGAIEKMTCHVWRESPFRVNRCLGDSVATHSCFLSDVGLSLSLFVSSSLHYRLLGVR